jgi:hypothetical protein
MARHIVLVCHDTAPRKAFELLRERIVARLGTADFESVQMISQKRMNDDPTVGMDIRHGDTILIGMSSPAANAEVEIRAADMARRYSRPFGFYADTFGAWKREWFKGSLKKAHFLFVVNEAEAREAHEAFPHLAVYPVGNPLWDEFWHPSNRVEARGYVGALETETVVLSPFTKTPLINFIKADMIISAIVAILRQTSFHDEALDGGHVLQYRLVFVIHLGDQTPRIYDALESYGSLLHPNLQIEVIRGGAHKILPHADVLIGPATSASNHAIACGVPIIDIDNPLIMEWTQKDTGSKLTYAALQGAAIPADHKMLFELLAALPLKHENAMLAEMRRCQEGLIPEITRDQVLTRITDILRAQ